MIDLTDILEKSIAGALVTGIVALAAYVGGRFVWLFKQTAQNEKDVNHAFLKIRELKKHIGVKDDDGNPTSRG